MRYKTIDRAEDDGDNGEAVEVSNSNTDIEVPLDDLDLDIVTIEPRKSGFPKYNEDSEDYEDDEEELTFERQTTCTGEPQMIKHGEHLTDYFRMHHVKMREAAEEERLARINAVKANLPVPQIRDFTDEVLKEELNSNFGEIDFEHPEGKSLFQKYREDRLKILRKWIKEEWEIRMTAIHDKIRNVRKAMRNGTTIEFEYEEMFPTAGPYNFNLNKVKSLEKNGCKCKMDFFRLPRKPCRAADCKARESHTTSTTEVDSKDEKTACFKKLNEWISKFVLGITCSAFWKSYMKENKIEEAELAKTLGVNKLHDFCIISPEIFHIPKTENPLNLMYPGRLADILETPHIIFSRIWHVIKVEIGGKDHHSRILTRDIEPLLKSSARIEVDLTNWGFDNAEEFCQFCIIFCEPPGNYTIHTFISNESNGSSVVALTLKNKEKIANDLDQLERERIAALPVPIRIKKQEELLKNIPIAGKASFMNKPEEVIRIPITRGTKWECFPDNVQYNYPLNLSVYPKVFKQLAEELHSMMMQNFESKDHWLLRVKINKKLKNPTKLVPGMHVVVKTPLSSPKQYILTEDSPGKYNYHRGVLVDNSSHCGWTVELYDRGIEVEVHENDMQLMCPEIYCYCPALATRVRLELPMYERTVETDFFCEFDEMDISDLERDISDQIPFDVIFLEEFPSKFSFDRFWKVSIITYYEERGKDGLSKGFNADHVIVHKQIHPKIQQAYTEYCNDLSREPLKQNYSAGSLKPEDIVDRKGEEIQYFFDITDSLWVLANEEN